MPTRFGNFIFCDSDCLDAHRKRVARGHYKDDGTQPRGECKYCREPIERREPLRDHGVGGATIGDLFTRTTASLVAKQKANKPVAKIHGWKKGHGGRQYVDVALHDMRTTPDVFWMHGNSYVLASATGDDPRYTFTSPSGYQVRLYSVNGHGEIRWEVTPSQVRQADNWKDQEWFPGSEKEQAYNAAKHFDVLADALSKGPQ